MDPEARALAIATLGDMVAAESNPALDSAALGSLLDSAGLVDGLGRGPKDPDWTPTYDMNRAAMEGWRLKAGKVAGDFSFTADNASYSKGEILANMERMVAMYAAKVNGSTGSPALRSYDWTELLP